MPFMWHRELYPEENKINCVLLTFVSINPVNMKKYLTVAVFILFFVIPSFAQPFTKEYIMSFLTCDASCTGFQDHMVNLAESDDGINWTLVLNFISYNGSVPDVVIRGNKLYLYTPGKVKRYDNSTDTWDSNTSFVSITDSIGGQVQFVDPSAYVDSAGRIVLFFLNSTGNPMGQDPAGCQTYPCIKYFDSATEIPGSDGAQFVKNCGHRTLISIPSGSASDPDIFFNGDKYIMYISRGGSTYACQSNSLHGIYTAMPNLTDGMLTYQGGVPCGFFDSISGNYWTYIHANVSGNTVIKQAVHADFNTLLNNFNTVISGPIIGEPSTTKTESPGFCTNDFLTTSLSEISNANIMIYPNPASRNINIDIIDYHKKAEIELYDIAGNIIASQLISKSEKGIDISTISKGIYILKIKLGNSICFRKITKI